MNHEHVYDVEDRISQANDKLNDIANMETVAYKQLMQAIPSE
jgi:hypothetical protein